MAAELKVELYELERSDIISISSKGEICHLVI